jgi:hypothetical protein
MVAVALLYSSSDAYTGGKDGGATSQTSTLKPRAERQVERSVKCSTEGANTRKGSDACRLRRARVRGTNCKSVNRAFGVGGGGVGEEGREEFFVVPRASPRPLFTPILFLEEANGDRIATTAE